MKLSFDHALHIVLGFIAIATIVIEMRYGEDAHSLIVQIERGALALTLIAAVLAVVTFAEHVTNPTPTHEHPTKEAKK